ncbi:MAG: RlmE family RNA methyltransferase [Alphaproteobacteria bacterium]|nr:RlmE family RNA methyltransferase [Alphaproteobacteria bacterium]
MSNDKPKSALRSVGSRRMAIVRVKTGNKRSLSSKKWLERQLNDPYVASAKADGYRSRAAYKILQLDEKFQLFKKNMKVIDLGAAPGGWSQVAVAKIGPKGKLIGIDLLPVDPIAGAEIIQMDFMSDEAPGKLRKMLGGKADIVLSDMAPSTTGHTGTDHIRIMMMAEIAALFATEILVIGGTFVCKFFKGGAEKELLDQLKKDFAKVRHAKPPASRPDSSETYLVAQGFRKPQ